MRQGLYAVLGLVVLAAAAGVCAGLVDFPVARLFQLDAQRVGDGDSSNGATDKLGARRSPVDGTAVTYAAAKARVDSSSSSNSSSSTTMMLRQVVVVDAQTLAADDDVFATLKAAAERGAAGALLVVPRSGAVPACARAAWRRLEARLFAEALPESCAVYVALREDVPARVLAAGGAVSLAVRAKPLVPMNGPKQKTPVALANVVATLSGARDDTADASADARPTVAVVANYDTFGVAPALAVGAAESAAPVAVLLELHRVFGALYAAAATRPDCDMRFVLTAGAALNYAGLRAWAAQQDPAPDFVLCLDSFRGSDDHDNDNDDNDKDTYYLHVSKPGSKDARVQGVYDAVVAGARAAGVRVAVQQKRVNVARDEFEWPHEALAVKRVLAATLTRARAPAAPRLLARATLLDRTAPAPAALANITRAAAEALARIVYPDTFRALTGASTSENAENSENSEEPTLFQGRLAVDEAHVAAWAEALAARGRCMPAASQVGAALVQTLQGALAPAAVQAWPLPGAQGQQQQPGQQRGAGGLVVDDGDDDDEVATAPARVRYTFYSWPPRTGADVRCIAHARTPALWDLFMLVFTAGFLLALHAALHGVHGTVAALTRAKRD